MSQNMIVLFDKTYKNAENADENLLFSVSTMEGSDIVLKRGV